MSLLSPGSCLPAFAVGAMEPDVRFWAIEAFHIFSDAAADRPLHANGPQLSPAARVALKPIARSLTTVAMQAPASGAV
jgi:hypothetical protein